VDRPDHKKGERDEKTKIPQNKKVQIAIEIL